MNVRLLRLSSLLLLICIISGCGCGLYFIVYKHVCFTENDKLKIYEWSYVSTDSQGRNLYFAKRKLPIKAKIENKDYNIIIFTPMNPEPTLFLKVFDGSGNELTLDGPFLFNIENILANDGFKYSFLVKQAKKKLLKITIKDKEGKILGYEALPFKVISRGFTFGFDDCL